jgi:hypothetical protein
MEVSDQLHTLTDLTMGKESLVPTGWVHIRASPDVVMKIISAPTEIQIPFTQPVASQCLLIIVRMLMERLLVELLSQTTE